MLFNMGSQAFSVMMMPAALVSQRLLRLAIMSYGESVAVVCCGQPQEASCCIWVMKEYGVAESWSKLYNINPPGKLYQISSIISLQLESGLIREKIATGTWNLRWYVLYLRSDMSSTCRMTLPTFNAIETPPWRKPFYSGLAILDSGPPP
ncbi:hypothetical protein RHSIM_Rhsim04G0065300 [Rhododendron simsii]|uniref:F-box associated domain-containing protein n=1 Tax=Rhododendron simsii TaxID=118357 RepID=A0A834HA73_RHOSS|nr:hypothetical protein RHSIM_Rhsim04G0065300 [Rhododendron simsii]